MFNVTTKSIQWGEETLTLETGKVARQADGTVIATLGETSVMANVTFAKKQKPGQDFFPLTVHYQEKYYAAGKIPGGFFKREARPTEKETLTARLIDRPIRPLFVPGFKNEVLVMCTVLSHDLVNDPDIVAMIAASAALTISGAPFMGPIAGARVGYEGGEYVLNPTVDDMDQLRNNPDQRLDLVVAGTKDAVMMVESEAYELTEAEMLGAVNFAHESIQPVIDLIIDLAEDCAKEPFEFEAPDYSELYETVKAAGEEQMRAAYAITDKQERTSAVAAAKDAIIEGLSEEQQEDENLGSALKKLESSVLRGSVVKEGKRIERHLLRQPALMEQKLRTNHDHRAARVVHALAQKVLAEAALLALEHVRQRLERALVGAGDDPAAATVVEQRIDRFLQHALLVAHDDVGRTKLD